MKVFAKISAMILAALASIGILSGCTPKEPPVRYVTLFPTPSSIPLTAGNTPIQLKEGGLELASDDVTGDSALLRFSLLDNSETLKVECSARGGEFAQATIAIVSKEAHTMKISGLKSGTSYLCIVHSSETKDQFQILGSVARNQNLGVAKASSEMIQFQTIPELKERYQGVIAVNALGESPQAPDGTPVIAQVSITWQPFLKADQKTVYRLVRVSRGGTLDMATKQVCTPDEMDSCMVCREMGTGVKSCTDPAVAPAPAQYFYSVGLEVNSWPEELPRGNSEKYLVTVPVPPANMVLVHRDAANAEMCSLLGRKTDPLAHQRCPYSGLGSVPKNASPGKSDLNLDPNFYDLGYSFFIDRWATACHWSPKTDTVYGRCGEKGTPGDCFGPVMKLPLIGVDGAYSVKECGPRGAEDGDPKVGPCTAKSTPPDSIGVDGSVYYSTSSTKSPHSRGGECFIKSGGTWKSADSPELTLMERSLMATNEPNQTTQRPPLVQVSQQGASLQCQGQNDGSYGAKRMMRRREYIVAAAWPHLKDEPGTLTDVEITSLENGMKHPENHACNTNTHEGVSPENLPFNSSHELARGAEDGPDSFVIGSTGTSKCVSRFGAQDMVGNTLSWVSDQLGGCSPDTHSCHGILSAFDSGNDDGAKYAFDGITGPGGSAGLASVDEWKIADPKYKAAYFSFPLGLPMVTKDGTQASAVQGSEKSFHDDQFSIFTDKSEKWGTRELSGPTRGGVVGGASDSKSSAGRFNYQLSSSPDTTSDNLGFRCVLPLE